ncbi:MAG: 2-enoyl thioester reductase domain-containing protein [Terrimicrobiaceae bacterium]
MNNPAVILNAFGKADECVRVGEWELRDPKAGEVTVEMLAAPINPADLNIIEGKYGDLPPLPGVPGSEGAGRIVAVGPDVNSVAVGALVALVRKGTWAKQITVPAEDVFPLPENTDVLQAAMLGVNPPTALLMMESFVTLAPGDWIVQNAANSAVGRSVIQIARALGFRTLNVVRRPELFDELLQLGADRVVTEDTDLREIAGNLSIRLALNAVGGASALNLANALGKDGFLVTYGAMGRQPLKIPNGLLIFKNLTFTGFWLSRWKKTTPKARQHAVFQQLADLASSGQLKLAVHQTYPINDIHAALAEAAKSQRSGKVLITF